MGTDFKDKTKKSFEKCWDKAAVEANTPDLFSHNSFNAETTYEAEPLGSYNPKAGDVLVLRCEQGSLIARYGNEPALEINNNTKIFVALEKGGGVAKVIVSCVDYISRVAEVIVE